MKTIETFLDLVGYGIVTNIGFASVFVFLRFRKFIRSLNNF
jgi:hypothetical protein